MTKVGTGEKMSIYLTDAQIALLDYWYPHQGRSKQIQSLIKFADDQYAQLSGDFKLCDDGLFRLRK